MTVEVRSAAPETWRIAGGTLDLSRPVVVGILNVTPDSFSDGGELTGPDDAIVRATQMLEAGAGMLDIGGESTRPGAHEVPEEEELRRVLPVVTALDARIPLPLSVDTRSSTVARAALEAGASVVNDVSALCHDPSMARVVAEGEAGLVLMHMRGDPATMQERTAYGDLLGDVTRELAASLDRAFEAGIPGERIVVDPGIGFAKTAEQSLTLIRALGRLQALGRPILVGPSRKSFLGKLLGAEPKDRVAGTVAACIMAYLSGARLFRVHDVAPVVQALAVVVAVAGDGPGSEPATGS